MDKHAEKIIQIALACGAAVGGYWVLKGIGNVILWLAPHMVTWWVILLLQIVGVVCAAGISLALATRICGSLAISLANRIEHLSDEQKRILQKLQERTPPLLVAATLITQAVMAIADKAFGDNPVIVVVVTILLIILFWIANEFMLRDALVMRLAGWSVWGFAILALPTLVALFHRWSIHELWTEVSKLSTGTLIVFALSIPVVILLPLACATRRSNVA